ncbi:MAG TPA: metallophosphoesterase, partial [Methanocella sp.]|nr:metallophosphoesterase [Methanocella sp.]
MGSILLFSDIHADIGALDQILGLSQSDRFKERYGDVSLTVNMGDVMERGHSPDRVIGRLESLANVESILGNHDEAFLGHIPVSGSDIGSEMAHEAYRATGQYERFFRGMGKYYVDTKEKLYVVHGGPIDPCAIAPADAAGIEAWIYTQPWQRISDIGVQYTDRSGYHYLPKDAFDAVNPAL